MGLRGVLDPQSAGYYRNIADERREFERKIRTVVRGIAVLAANLRMLNPFRYGLFSWQLASHKLCRWLVPFAMIGAALSNACGSQPSRRSTRDASLAQSASSTRPRSRACGRSRRPAHSRVFRPGEPGVLMAWLRFARGERIVTWTPSERVSTLPQVSRRGR